MRNLEYLSRFTGQIQNLPPAPEHCNIAATYYDNTTGRIYILYISNQSHYLAIFKTENIKCPIYFKKIKDTDLTQLYQSGQSQNSQIISFQLIQQLESLVIVFESGHIFTYNLSNYQLDSANFIPQKILAASWSPNEQTLLLVTKNGKINLMNTDFFVLKQTDLDDNDDNGVYQSIKAKQPDFIKKFTRASISWRADGQMMAINYLVQGLGYKCLTRNLELTVIKGPARADPQGGVVQSVSENPSQQMHLPICFHPQGSCIAGFEIKQLKNNEREYRVVFWEKNGLRHGELILENNEAQNVVKHISWNHDASILCLVCQKESIDHDVVLLYVKSNYKYFMKKKIDLDADVLPPQWIPERFPTLFIMNKLGYYEILKFKLDYSTSTKSSNKPCDNSWVANIDSNKVLVTPHKLFSIPPPLSFAQITLSNTKDQILVDVVDDYLISVTSRSMYVVKLDPKERIYEQSSVKQVGFPKCVKSPKKVTSFVKGGMLHSYILAPNISDQQQTRVNEVIVDLKQWKIVQFKSRIIRSIINSIILPSSINHDCMKYYFQNTSQTGPLSLANLSLLNHSEQQQEQSKDIDTVYLQQNDGKVLKFDQNLSEFLTIPTPSLLQIQMTHVNNIEKAISLDYSMNLYINDNIFAKDVTNFFISQNFLLFIQSTSGLLYKLFIFDLNQPLPIGQNSKNSVNQLSKIAQLQKDTNFNVRSVERGARIATVSETKVVLQMPRGNLQIIYPRLLMFAKIKELIKPQDLSYAPQYGLTFRLLRQHKINLNLIYDLNPQKFVNNIQLFIKQVGKIEFLNLFINSIQDESSSELKFILKVSQQDNIKQEIKKTIQQSDLFETQQNSKINKICQCLLKKMKQVNQKFYTLPILTCLVKWNKIQQALSYVFALLQHDKKNVIVTKSKAPHLLSAEQQHFKSEDPSSVTGKEALEYLCWIGKPDKLFNFALQTYNFKMVTMVAKYTQRDPKEYLPYLQKLKSMEQWKMKHHIAIDTKMFTRALQILAQQHLGCQDDLHTEKRKQIEQLTISLIEKEKLHSAGIQIFKNNGEFLSQLQYSSAESLSKKHKNYQAAAMFYLSGGFLKEAIESFKKCRKVSQVIQTCKSLNLQNEQIQKHVEDMIPSLEKQQQFQQIADALSIANHTQNIEQSCLYYCKSLNFKKAYLYCKQLKKQDLINTTIKKSLTLSFDLLKNQLLKAREQYIDRITRVKLIQQKKKKMPDMNNTNNIIFDWKNAESDLVSQSEVSDSSQASSSSNLSALSAASRMTKQSKKKDKKRKKLGAIRYRNVKQGVPFEEEMLIDILKDFKPSGGMVKQYKQLQEGLVLMNMLGEAQEIKKMFLSYEKLVNRKYFTLLQQSIMKEINQFELIFPEVMRVKMGNGEGDDEGDSQNMFVV